MNLLFLKIPHNQTALKSLRLSAKGFIVGGILRNGKAIIPRGNDVILPEDQLIIFTQPQKVKQVERLFCDNESALRYEGMIPN